MFLLQMKKYEYPVTYKLQYKQLLNPKLPT